MKSLGFELTDPEENEFHKGPLKVGIATDGDMLDFSGVNPKKLKVVNLGARYRVLSPSDFLATYKASSLDGYRKEKHQQNDDAKIKLIESVLLA